MFNENAAITAATGTAGNVHQYNWDNIEVGDFHLDNSGQFFERRQRDTKEKENDRNGFNVRTITHGLENIFLKSTNSPSISHRGIIKNNFHENIPTTSQQPKDQLNNKMLANSQNLVSSNLTPISRPMTRAAMKEKNIQQINPSTQSTTVQQQNQRKELSRPPKIQPPKTQPPKTQPSKSQTAVQPPAASRTRSQTSTAVVATSKAILPVTKVFSVVRYEELYRKKKEQKLMNLAAEDKRNRQFKRNPVPNFAAAHRQMDKKLLKIPKPQICYPETPQTLKNSIKAREIRDKKIAEQQKSKIEPFVAIEAKVLEQNPYKPHLDHRHIVANPFQLRMLERLADRREYDKKYEEQCEEKRQRELLRKEKEDQEQIKQFRQQTKFKARPNPFH